MVPAECQLVFMILISCFICHWIFFCDGRKLLSCGSCDGPVLICDLINVICCSTFSSLDHFLLHVPWLYGRS